MNNIKYIPISYYTYNSHNLFLSTTITILFSVFFAISYLAFSYETSNKADVCNPTFYYGNACKRHIAKSVLLDEKFLNRKRVYYKAAENNNSNIRTDNNNVEYNVNDRVSEYLSDNKEFNDKTVKEIEDITDVLNLIATKYLGNIQQFLSSSTQSTSEPVISAINNIPGMIKSVQDKLNKAVVEPTSAAFVSPLQKLYKALLNIDTIQNS